MLCHCRSKDDDKPSFSLHPCLRDRNTELTYLRHICDYILILTLPPEAARISSLRYILREVLAGLGTSQVFAEKELTSIENFLSCKIKNEANVKLEVF